MATLVGVAARLTGPERARRRAAREKDALDNAPDALRPAFERMYWEASVHLVALTLSAASYGRFRGLWVVVSLLTLLGLGVFSMMLAAENTRDSTTVALVALYALASWGIASVAGAIEGSRRRLYRKVFDKLHAREDPDPELLAEARAKDSHKGSVLLSVLFGFSAIVLVGALGVYVGAVGMGSGLAVAPARILSLVLLFSVLGVAVSSWFLLVQWTRRPLHTLFPSDG